MTFNQGSQGNVYLTGACSHDDTYGFDYHTSSENCYPLGYSTQSPAKSSDWTFLPASPYIESPLSSVGAYADSSWDPFDQSFYSIQSSVEDCNFVPTGYQPAQSRDIQSGTQRYGSLAAFNETTAFDNTIDNKAPGGPYETSPLASPGIKYRSREPSWGSRRNSSSSSSFKPVPPTKRRKSSDKGSHSSHSHSKSDSIPRLRSTTQPSSSITFSSSSSSSKSPPVSESSKGRTNHNQVEKQYRNRLNGQFETLLSTLPSEDDKYGANPRVSKAEVLMLAQRHIVELEREKMMLESDVEELKRRFLEIGGVCMP
ncbi:hypothetical protein N431DRAFT_448217 [Stipitochalara longipes BDJ]|nr:hypothetical protein N431DRAFT_448217 [Stipitochalara longipes BDJ]